MSALTHNLLVDRFIADKRASRQCATDVQEAIASFVHQQRSLHFPSERDSHQEMSSRHNNEKHKYFYHNSKAYDKNAERRDRKDYRVDTRSKYSVETKICEPHVDRKMDTRRSKEVRDKPSASYRCDRSYRSDFRRDKHFRYPNKSKVCTELDFRSHSGLSSGSGAVAHNYYPDNKEYVKKGSYENDTALPREYSYENEHQASHMENPANKSVYYSVKSDEEVPEMRDSREVFTYTNVNSRRYIDKNHNNSNLSPVSSTSSALTTNMYFSDCNSERSAVPTCLNEDLFGVNDVDLRFRRQTKEIGIEIRCQYQTLGCQVVARLDSITNHEKECAFNPRNAKTVCKLCKLIVTLEHDCVSELREELNNVTKRTDWFKHSNASQAHNSEEGANYVWVHFYGDKEEKVAKFKVTSTDDSRSVIKRSLQHLGLTSQVVDDVCEESQFQLVFSSFHVLSPTDTFDSFTTHFPQETHLILIPKIIQIKVTARKLYCENQHVMISVPTSVPFEIDPTLTVYKFKQTISAKIPVDWSKHNLEYSGRPLIDSMLLYVVGLSKNEKIDIIAV